MKSLFPPNGLLGEGLCFWMIHARWVLGCAPITDSPRLLTGTPWVSLLLSERGEFYLSPSHSVFSRRVSLWSQPLFLVRLVKFLTPGWRRLSAETCPPLFPQGRGRGARGHTLHPAPCTLYRRWAPLAVRARWSVFLLFEGPSPWEPESSRRQYLEGMGVTVFQGGVMDTEIWIPAIFRISQSINLFVSFFSHLKMFGLWAEPKSVGLIFGLGPRLATPCFEEPLGVSLCTFGIGIGWIGYVGQVRKGMPWGSSSYSEELPGSTHPSAPSHPGPETVPRGGGPVEPEVGGVDGWKGPVVPSSLQHRSPRACVHIY